ncbi:MAG: hypothetical protein AAGA17_03685 [Actinomycetota bacterium]
MTNVQPERTVEAAAAEEEAAQRTFSISIVVSAIRCLLTYVVLPFVTPFLGLASGVGPILGIVIGLVAIAANVVSIRRFHRARHPWRRPVTVVHVGIIALVTVLIGIDVADLL